ncbi:MAG: hypothetical protein J6S02_03850 [Bacteroidaceae bacterium]|nr:hypothetical protein [Bacteroidaceae bacterium]
MDEEEFVSSPQDVLAFSVDSVDFDTLIAGELSHTQTFQVYNHNKAALRIKSVSLQQGASSIFRVNVDGTALINGTATDFQLRSGDSLRIFINSLTPSCDSDIPVAHTDKLLFELESGVVQELPLEIHGWDVVKLQGMEILEDVTLNSRRPYQVLDSLVVRPDASLTIPAGTRLFFHKDASLIVYGRLNVQGNAENNVVFRGDRLGNMFTNQSYDCIPGQWGGIRITAQSYGNQVNFADIHSGNYGILCDSSNIDAEKIRIENSIIHNTSGDGLTLLHVKALVGNSQLTNAGGNCVNILGGDVSITHCTIAQFYAFTASCGVALLFANTDGTSAYPLQNLEVANSIITGYATDEIMGENAGDDSPFNYTFRNCLLNTPSYEAPEIVNCLWDTDENAVYRADNFYPAFDLDRLLYRFTLAPQSLAVGTADATITSQTYLLDRMGIPRTATPSMGCYEYVKNE